MPTISLVAAIDKDGMIGMDWAWPVARLRRLQAADEAAMELLEETREVLE